MQFPLFRLYFFRLNFIQAFNDVRVNRSILDSEKDNHGPSSRVQVLIGKKKAAHRLQPIWPMR
jgi:hypothetical protein